jgi:hypothetical protein
LKKFFESSASFSRNGFLKVAEKSLRERRKEKALPKGLIMARKKSGDGDAMLVAEAKSVTTALPKIQSKLARGLDVKQGNALIAAHEKNIVSAGAVEKLRAEAVRKKESSAAAVRTFVTRVRSSARGAFGGDSDEYASVGGTRTSDRKKPTRKPKPPGSTTTK